mmetsp:Transcript_11729/g.21328  ORF Transcript_11729/g.21328 Transcript_11729/m.21328 type:complete len:314 (+) Transcript_11729:125-1066(+)
MDPLSAILAQKKSAVPTVGPLTPTPAARQSSCAKALDLKPFDVDSTLGGRRGNSAEAGSPQVHGKDGHAAHLVEVALAPSSNVDFPMVTDICESVAGNKAEMFSVVDRLLKVLADVKAPPRQKLKSLTILHELVYDEEAVHAVANSTREAQKLLGELQQVRDTGLGEAADEQIRMFATELERSCFTSGHQATVRKRDKAMQLMQEISWSAREAFSGSDSQEGSVVSRQATVGSSNGQGVDSSRKRDLARDLLWDMGTSLQESLASAAQTTFSEAQAAAEWAADYLQQDRSSPNPATPGSHAQSPKESSKRYGE